MMHLNTLPRRLLIVGLISTLLLSSCGNKKTTNHSINEKKSTDVTSQSVDTPITQQNSPKDPEPEWLIDPTREFEDITEADFKPEVAIDFEQYKEGFFNDEIIIKINETLKAIVAQDKEKFLKHLHEDYAKYAQNSSLFAEENAQYMFYDLGTLEKYTIDNLERINVGVQLAKKSSDNSIDNTMIMFTFNKNKEDQWGIANID